MYPSLVLVGCRSVGAMKMTWSPIDGTEQYSLGDVTLIDRPLLV
jgi:hypothetical protein